MKIKMRNWHNLLIAVLLIGCSNNNKVEYTYYDSGIVKTKKVYNSVNDTLNYYLESYYPNGNVFQSGYFKNGKTEGLVKQFSEKGNLKIMTPFIQGEKNGSQINYNEEGGIESQYYFEDDTVLLMYNYIDDKGIKIYTVYEGNPVLTGMLTLNNNEIVKDKSYYYKITSKDSLKLGVKESVEIEVFNKGKQDKSIEIILIDRFGKFKSIDNKVINSDSLKTSFIIEPKERGFALLSGIINIKGKSLEVEKQFYLHKFFYIE